MKRQIIWKLFPDQSKNAEYSVDVAKEEGSAYIEQLKNDYNVLEIIEEEKQWRIFIDDKE